MRIILFTGKGGVGKTTIAAATATRIAARGLKTLIISTDPAHSLADAIDQKIGPEPTFISENLYGQELDVYYSMQKYWKNLRQLIQTVFRWQGVDRVLAEEMSAIPGMEEGSAFMWIEKYYSENKFDVIIIDSAPTGETLTLLTLPQVTRWWVTKAFPLQKFAIKVVGKGIRKTTGIPLDKGYEELQLLFDKLESIHKVFSNPEICSIRIVTNPEKMVINESKRAYTYLQLYGYAVDSVIINRIMPKSEEKGFFNSYINSQSKYIKEIEESFSPVPIFKAEHIGEEVFGLDLLKKIADKIYGDEDPSQIFFNEKTMIIKESDKGYQIKLKLSFMDDSSYKINKFGDELVIEIANRRHNVLLPKFTNFHKLLSYDYKAPWLLIELEKNK
ncbi:MAG: ArsA family ATPase [Bacteroidetes bacterium]|nr:MAG: ArsA family ATPase [Bacteroidota bacterium]